MPRERAGRDVRRPEYRATHRAGDAGYYIDITPLKASTHELRITAGWDIPKDRLVTIRAGSKTRLLERGRYTTVTGQLVRLSTEKKLTWQDKLANW